MNLIKTPKQNNQKLKTKILGRSDLSEIGSNILPGGLTSQPSGLTSWGGPTSQPSGLTAPDNEQETELKTARKPKLKSV